MALEKTNIDTSWIDALQMTMQDSLKPMFSNIFQSVQGVLYNGVAYTFIGIWIMFWCLNLLKNGYPTREEIFNSLKWILMLCFIFGIFYSYESYTSFLGWLMIPAQWLKSATSHLFGTNTESFGVMVTNAINSLNDLMVKLWEKGLYLNKDNFTPEIAIKIGVAFGMIPFWIFYGTTFFVIAGVACIILSSTFFAMIILSLAPVVIPLLFSKKTAPYFYSWLKLFISYSLYVPASYIILSICMIPMKKISELGTDIQQIYDNQFVNFLVPTLISAICIYLLIKIPNWVSQIIGVQGLEAGGTGGALDLAKTAGSVGASFGTGFLAKKMVGGSLGQSMTSGLANAVPMAKTIKGLVNAEKKVIGGIEGVSAKAG